MKRAVKNLIKDRGLEKYDNVVQVESIPTRPIGFCHSNACEEMELHKTTQGSPVKVVGGWIVGNWDGRMAGVIQHFWNYDTRTCTHYDTTKSGYFRTSNNVTYVIDDKVHNLKWTDDMKGIAYLSDNKPYIVGKHSNIQIDDFSNQTIERLCKMLKKIDKQTEVC